MTLTEIENLSFADLKAKRDELLIILKDAEHGELAARYLQARTDAKQREEKLSEQGKTIEALQAGMDAAAKNVSTLEGRLRDESQRADTSAAAVNAAEQRLASEAVAAKQAQGELQLRLSGETSRADAAEALAKSRRTALADVMTTISPVLAAE